MTDVTGVTGALINAHNLGVAGDSATALSTVKSLEHSPIEAFAVLASYFAGQANKKMEDKLAEYSAKSDEYTDVLELSQAAHTYKAEAKAQEGKDGDPPKPDQAFRDGMDRVLSGSGKTCSDIIPADGTINQDRAQTCIDAINQKKDILSTDLQSLSTEMDMAIKDAGEAEQMAANAIKKYVDLITTQGKSSGG